MIERILSKKISALLDGRKAITIMGARQVGKSTLLQMMLGERKDVMWLNGDEPDIVEILGNMTSPRLKAMIGNNTIIVIDEAQRIPDIGLRLKLITDQIPDVQVIATGSRSFD